MARAKARARARAMARAMAMQVDRLSNLPDYLLCNILSHLPLLDAIRTSILSTRWRSLWTQIPNLHFCEDFFDSMDQLVEKDKYMRNQLRRSRVHAFLGMRESISDYKSLSSACVKYIIDKILLNHSAAVESFKLDILEGKFDSVCVGQWIERAAQKGVKRMSLSIKYGWPNLFLPPPVFDCCLLTHMDLCNLVFTQLPTGFGGFLFLRTCSLSHIDNFTDDKFENLVLLCPLLQKLVVRSCENLINMKVQAPNLNCLSVLSCSYVESLRAHSSQLEELKVEYCDEFSVLEINSSICMHSHASHTISSVKSIKKLSLKIFLLSLDPSLLLHCSFPDLEELNLPALFVQDIAPSLKQTGMVGSTEMVESRFNFPNLKKAYLNISLEIGKNEVNVLAFLLRNAPSLKVLTLILPHCLLNIHNQELIKEFINQVRDLMSLETELRILDDGETVDAVICVSDSEYYSSES